MKLMKRSMKMIFITLVACITLMQATGGNVLANNGGYIFSHSITYIGGGVAPYNENGTTYYRGGNILELSINVPPNTNATGFQEVVTYDMNQLELVTSFNEIRDTMDSTFRSATWTLGVSKYNGNSNQIQLYSVADDPVAGRNTSGGSIAKIRFKVKNTTENAQGMGIHLNFNRFQLITYENGSMKYIHQGYDANNDVATAYINLPSLSVLAHKTPAVVPNPEPKPTLPDVEFDREVVLSKEISAAQREAIAKILSTRNYSFKALDGEKVNGVNSFVSIIKEIVKKGSSVNDEKYNSYEFSGSDVTSTPVDTGSSYSYTHYIFLLLSFAILSATVGYNMYQNFKQKNKWRTSNE